MLGVFDDALTAADDLTFTSPAFEDGGRVPTLAGFVNENENPPLAISGVPDDAESLVLTMIHPEAAEVVDHAWVHWTAWGIDPAIEEIPRDWEGTAVSEGYNNFLRQGCGGPSPPPESVETYRFRVYAIDSELSLPPATRRRRLASTFGFEAEVVAADELTGT